MATKASEEERQAFESKIKGAHKVEIKITVPDEDEQRAYEALEIARRDAARRQIYFFDTPELSLYEAGVVPRTVPIENDQRRPIAVAAWLIFLSTFSWRPRPALRFYGTCPCHDRIT